ncbi:MAG: GSU2403 family nucleotidyltransferase fold protein [Planctomycetota bacterium]
MINRLPEDTQTLYAELLASLLAAERERSWSHLSGTFTTKTVKGLEYLYFQYSDPGGSKRQLAIGRRDAALDEVVRQYEAQRIDHEADRARVARLARLLGAAGVELVPHGSARIIRALSDAGVFAAGGTLVGSYAFLVIGNLLGVEWPEASWRTQDVDIAGHMQLAIPDVEADVPRALESLKMGFVPVPQLDPAHPTTSFRVRGQPLRVDLLTPGREEDSTPIHIKRFKAAASPVKFLSLVMKDAQPGVAIEANSATLVVVPSPARFALHKLLVSQNRSVIQQTKSGKDLHQAALLIEVLAEDRPDDLESATAEFTASGAVVVRKIERGLAAAGKRWPSCEHGAKVIRSTLAD